MRKFPILTVFLIAAILFSVPLKLHGETIHYKYELDDSQNATRTVTYWLSEKGFHTRITEGNGTTNMIYNVPEETMYIYEEESDRNNQNQPRVQKISRAEVRRLVQKIKAQQKKMEAKLENMPPEQRKQMKQMMGGEMKNPEEVRKNYETEFVQTGETTWDGRPAIKGDIMQGDQKQAEVVMLKEDLMAVSESQLRGIRGFGDLLKEFMTLVGSMPGGGEAPSLGANDLGGQFFVGPKFLRVVESKSENGEMKLVDWGTGSSPHPDFKPPANYPVQSIGDQMD